MRSGNADIRKPCRSQINIVSHTKTSVVPKENLLMYMFLDFRRLGRYGDETDCVDGVSCLHILAVISLVRVVQLDCETYVSLEQALLTICSTSGSE
jgi:hypothetical protein